MGISVNQIISEFEEEKVKLDAYEAMHIQQFLKIISFMGMEYQIHYLKMELFTFGSNIDERHKKNKK